MKTLNALCSKPDRTNNLQLNKDKKIQKYLKARPWQVGTFVDVGVKVAVFLGVRSDLAVVLVDEDAHFRQQLHLLLIQVICGYFWHSNS